MTPLTPVDNHSCNSLQSGALGPQALRGEAYQSVSNDVTSVPKLWAGRKITPGHSAPCNTLHPALTFKCKFPPPKVALTGTIGMLGLRLKPSKKPSDFGYLRISLTNWDYWGKATRTQSQVASQVHQLQRFAIRSCGRLDLAIIEQSKICSQKRPVRGP